MSTGFSVGGFDEIYSVLDLPVFQNLMFQSPDEARSCVRGDVNLVRDTSTGLIFNRSFRPELMSYDANYQNEQAVSGVFREHLANVAAIIEGHFSGQSLIEVGCGKGHFLELLQLRGFSITGMDPAYEGENSSIIKRYFSPEVGLRADGIVLRHVLEHVQNPVRFLSELLEANGGRGKIYIEVPCFEWICAHKAWFDIFYEHVNYFRLSDFHRMFGVVYDSGHVFAGQYLYVIADLASVRKPVPAQLDRFKFPSDFLSSVDENAKRLKSRETIGSAIWGGASKGVVFALFMERSGASIDLVVDVNPAKHGKYLPGTGLQVCSPVQAMDRLPPGANVVVMNGNYLQEIRALTGNQFNYLAVDHDSI
jgi:Methyltransferase domain/C-methyltransferase C-terminal domain